VVDRERLLDAAERVIARDGHGASLDAIALEAGVTKPVVYARVGSRAALADALAERFADRLAAQAGAAVAGRPFDRGAVAALCRAVLETAAHDRELYLYVTRGSGDDTPERTLHLAARSARPLAELLAHWRTRAGAGAAAAETWAYAIVGMLNLVTLWWVEDAARPAAQVADDLAELVWSGLAPTS
jgi:AcrR family transcriptional regulator